MVRVNKLAYSNKKGEASLSFYLVGGLCYRCITIWLLSARPSDSSTMV